MNASGLHEEVGIESGLQGKLPRLVVPGTDIFRIEPKTWMTTFSITSVLSLYVLFAVLNQAISVIY